MNGTIKKFALPLIAGVFTVFAAGCGNSLGPDDHPDAGGVVIFQRGTQNLVALSVGVGAAFNNPITVPRGQEVTFDVRFLDAAAPTNLARAFVPDASEGESLRVTVQNSAIARAEAHGDHVDFTGVAAGTTTATFDLMHGGHSDFRSGALTLIVQ
jgi:hypothetical protein